MVIIDPGHGGNDPGSIGNGITEKDYNLQISKYMYERLKDLNIPVVLTREIDETVSPTERIERIKNFGDVKGNILISNHINSATNTGADGAEVLYALRGTDVLPNYILEELNKEGQNIRSAYQRVLPSDQTKDYNFLFRETCCLEPMIVEYGFLSSSKDDPTQIKQSWKDFSEAVVRAISKYLNIPYTPPVSETNHVVQKGDTLYGIAKKYNTSVESLLLANNLTPSSILRINEVLKIPGEVIPSPSPTSTTTHTVQAGESLYSIGIKYGVPYEVIKTYNNLNNNILNIGQQLIIPTLTTGTSNYYVKAGDTLYSIAKEFGVTVDEIKKLNNLTSNLISVGQLLITPNVSTPSLISYSVKKGDTLYGIAQKFNTTINRLLTINKLTNSDLSIGQTLLIPIN